MKTRFLLILYLGLFEINLLGHEQIVHQAITTNAAASALANSPAYAGFLDSISIDLPQVDAINFMVIGSFNEDFGPESESLGGHRSLNHFYDPIKSPPMPLTEQPPPLGAMPLGRDSFTWASVSNGVGLNISYNKNTMNIWSWPNARGYEWIGLTAANRSDRHDALTNLFRSLGQVVHLLEDTSQPQHVRNEQHLDLYPFWPFTTVSTPWRSPIEVYGKKHLNELKYAHTILPWRVDGFTKLEDFWNRHLYINSSSPLVADANASGVSSARLGLAEFSNGNFLGARHLFPEYFKSGDIEYYPFPSRETSSNYRQVKANPSSGIEDNTFENGHIGKSIYLKKNGDGIQINHIARVNYLGIKTINGLGGGTPYCTIADDKVLKDYHDALIPKAVEYSAGLLDYFFRGTMSVQVVGISSDNPPVATNVIVNTSSQPFSDGTFRLFYDDTNGVRTEITILSSTYSSPLATNGSFTLAFTTVPDAARYILVYQGSIGTTDPVDSGIAVGVKTFFGRSSWHNSFEIAGGNLSPANGDYFCDGWHVDDGDVDVGANGTWGDNHESMAYEGNYILDLDGDQPGTISTNIPTIAGKTYQLNFVWCRNPDSITGVLGQDPHVPSAQVLIDDALVMTLVGNMNNSWLNLQWQQANYTFTASSSSTKLTFRSTSPLVTFSGIQLDAIDLQEGF